MGKPTRKPMAKAENQILRNCGPNPALTKVRTKDMKNDIVKVTKTANTIE
jgi:hypothetical protein